MHAGCHLADAQLLLEMEQPATGVVDSEPRRNGMEGITLQGESDMSPIASELPTQAENGAAEPAADGPVSNLLAYASGVGVDDVFANLGVPYGSSDTPAQAYTTYLAGVGVDDVFANAAGVGAVAGIGDPVAAVGQTGDQAGCGQRADRQQRAFACDQRWGRRLGQQPFGVRLRGRR